MNISVETDVLFSNASLYIDRMATWLKEGPKKKEKE